MRTLIVLLVVMALIWSVRVLGGSSSQQAKIMARNILIAFAILGFLFLLLTGRLHWIGVLILAILPFLKRILGLLHLLPWLQKIFAARRAPSGPAGGGGQKGSAQVSTVSTRFLVMRLDQRSGEIDGEVIEGGLKGRQLSELSLDQLLALAREVSVDSDSLALLQAYMDRVHPDWQDRAGAQAREEPSSSAEMNLQQALDILGLPDNPTRQQVIKAHRRLMQKIHPDQGGSTYLAAKVNLAKQYVLDYIKNHS